MSNVITPRAPPFYLQGAIEGTIWDYKMASAYATEFKYSRFDLRHAETRDTSKLTGHVHPANGADHGTVTDIDEDDLARG